MRVSQLIETVGQQLFLVRQASTSQDTMKSPISLTVLVVVTHSQLVSSMVSHTMKMSSMQSTLQLLLHVSSTQSTVTSTFQDFLKLKLSARVMEAEEFRDNLINLNIEKAVQIAVPFFH